MRLLAASALLLTGCGPGLEFNVSMEMNPQQMLDRATHVFVGVIQKQQYDSWPFFRVVAPGQDPAGSEYWRVLRREVRVEMVLRGREDRRLVDIYEISWTGGASGDWNSTRDGDRALFLVRVENGRYHVVRDWWRSIFPVTSGRHTRLPLDDAQPFWERVALMNWWFQDAGERQSRLAADFYRNDPGNALGLWRTVKIERGLVRHPNPLLRRAACRELLLLAGWGEDECWEMLSDEDKAHLTDGGWVCCSAKEVDLNRQNLRTLSLSWWWTRFSTRDERRLLTTVSNPRRRAEFCGLYEREYPGDDENGCPAEQPPPATIVTENGDVPLIGPWPN